MDRPLRICLAASGGGHLRQLLDLEAVWSQHDHFFVTTDFSLGRSVAQAHRMYFVEEFGVGMWNQGQRWRMLSKLTINFWQAARIVLYERPHLVITTGAAAIFWTVVMARLCGARLVSIESFARMEAPSVYGRLVRPFADHVVVQSAKLKAFWPEALVFDPLEILDQPRPPKEPLTFVTVGALTAFDRMVDAALDAKASGALPAQMIVQTGEFSRFLTSPSPDIDFVESFDFATIQDTLRRAEIVICHGGTGSIITALRAGCRVIAMQRRFDFGEAYDDHQGEIIRAFVARGLIDAAETEADLVAAIGRAKARQPVCATTNPTALRAYLRQIITELNDPASCAEHCQRSVYGQRQQRKARQHKQAEPHHDPVPQNLHKAVENT